jgi:hypothetical protein
VKFSAVASGILVLWQASGMWFGDAALVGSPEPLWMVLWGVALLGFAAAARDHSRRHQAEDDVDSKGGVAWTAIRNCSDESAVAASSRQG